MATKKKEVKIRETKENTFSILKSIAPGIFGASEWVDVAFFGEDPDDTSKLIIVFTEEND